MKDKIHVAELTKFDCLTGECSVIKHIQDLRERQPLGAYMPYTDDELEILGCFGICPRTCFCFKPLSNYQIIWIRVDDCKNIEQFDEEFSYTFDNYKI